MNLEATYAGPVVHKTEKVNPTEVISRLIRQRPRATKETIERLFIAEIEDDQKYMVPIVRYFFLNAWNSLHPVRRSPGKIDKAEVDKVANRLRAVIIGELIMPNGKQVAACTGTEMTVFGDFGTEVGRIAKRKVVGKVLNEQALVEIWTRVKGFAPQKKRP